MTHVSRRFACLSLFALAACSATGSADKSLRDVAAPVNRIPLPGSPPAGTEADIAELAVAIAALGPGVDPAEASRAARISYDHTYELAIQYEITDPALVHNNKVNRGIKPRGLCKHWAEDMENRLVAENFQTLDIHRGIGAMFGVDHSTAIISAKGDSMYDGIVVDPWRRGGRLTWVATDKDMIWGWEPQFVVHDRTMRAVARESGQDRIVYSAEGSRPRCLVISDPATGLDGVASSTDLSRCMGLAVQTISG